MRGKVLFIKRIIKKTVRKYRDVGLYKCARWFWLCTKIKLRLLKSTSDDYMSISRSKCKDTILKTSPKIFICSGVPYYDIGGGQRSAQLAKTFNKMGYAVYYFYAFKSTDVSSHSVLPLCAHHIIEDDTALRIAPTVTKDDIFIFESPAPSFSKLLDVAAKKGATVIYESIDNWESSLGSGVFSEVMLRRLLREAKVLVGTARPLVSQLKDYLKKYDIEEKPVLYLPNAVDSELFCSLKKHALPEDMKTGRVTLLYFGSLWGEWFDWELIFNLAHRHPEYCINLIGDYSCIPDMVKAAPYNVRFLGSKPHSHLPAYLAHTDYAIIPFRCGDISDYVSPLKIFEYIAMGARVISTPLPDIEEYPNVFTGSAESEWESIIERSQEKVSYESFTNENSWEARASALLSSVLPQSESFFKDKLSVIVLNRNNKDIISKCIDSLVKYNFGYEIIVIDNCSTDGSYEMLSQYGSAIRLLRNSKNGCASGRNLGAIHSKSEYLLFLDSDQWPTRSHWLRPYEEIIRAKRNVGIIGWAAGFFDKTGKAHHVVDSFPHRYMPPDSLARCDVGYLGSGGMLISRKTFLSVGGFDANYDPTCYEDTDISLAVRDCGLELYYCPHLGITHLPHQTTKSGSEGHRRITEEKQRYFTKKWTAKNPDLLKYIK